MRIRSECDRKDERLSMGASQHDNHRHQVERGTLFSRYMTRLCSDIQSCHNHVKAVLPSRLSLAGCTRLTDSLRSSFRFIS
jgi:hypothetical protein